MSTAVSHPVLELRDLRVDFLTSNGPVTAVRGVDLVIAKGEAIGLVGESGSGKTQTVLSALGLGAANATVAGSARLGGVELLGRRQAEVDALRGRQVGFIFQNPMTALTPHLTVGRQLTEGLQVHHGLNRKQADARAIAMLGRVGIAEPERRMRSYPHEFSGGMRQRVMIAIALLCEPALLVADEPTTALDATIQAQILDLIDDLRRRDGLAVLFISHNLGAVARICDRVCVMYAGEIVESAPCDALFAAPRHPYARALLKSLPRLDGHGGPPAAIRGEPPALGDRLSGCAFAPRCDERMVLCGQPPPRLTLPEGRTASCHRFVAP